MGWRRRWRSWLRDIIIWVVLETFIVMLLNSVQTGIVLRVGNILLNCISKMRARLLPRLLAFTTGLFVVKLSSRAAITRRLIIVLTISLIVVVLLILLNIARITSRVQDLLDVFLMIVLTISASALFTFTSLNANFEVLKKQRNSTSRVKFRLWLVLVTSITASTAAFVFVLGVKR